MTKWVTNLLTVLLVTTIISLALALIIAIFGEAEAKDRAAILIEASKAIFQFLFVIMLGGLATLLINSFDKRRRGYKALQDFRQEFLDGVSTSYQDAKRARRVLRTGGLTKKFGDQNPSMTKDRRDAYQDQMLRLNEVQLALERLKIEAGNFPGAFSASVKLEQCLQQMEAYLRNVTKEYEQHWSGLAKDPPTVRFDQLLELDDFTGPFAETRFSEFSTNYYTALRLIRRDLLPIQDVHAGWASFDSAQQRRAADCGGHRWAPVAVWVVQSFVRVQRSLAIRPPQPLTLNVRRRGYQTWLKSNFLCRIPIGLHSALPCFSRFLGRFSVC